MYEVYEIIKTVDDGGAYIGEYFDEASLKKSLTNISKSLREYIECDWCILECIEDSEFEFVEPFFYLHLQDNAIPLLDEIVFMDNEFILRIEQFLNRLEESEKIILNKNENVQFKLFFLRFAPIIRGKIERLECLKKKQKDTQQKHPFKNEAIKSDYDILTAEWNYNKDLKYSYIYNFLEIQHEMQPSYKADFEKFVREKEGFVGKFQYEHANSTKRMKELQTIYNNTSAN